MRLTNIQRPEAAQSPHMPTTIAETHMSEMYCLKSIYGVFRQFGNRQSLHNSSKSPAN